MNRDYRDSHENDLNHQSRPQSLDRWASQTLHDPQGEQGQGHHHQSQDHQYHDQGWNHDDYDEYHPDQYHPRGGYRQSHYRNYARDRDSSVSMSGDKSLVHKVQDFLQFVLPL